MPNTGPSDGSREVMTTFLPMCARPCVRLMAVTVLPSPAAVGVVAVTMISLPRRLKEGSERSSRRTLPLSEPICSKYLSGSSSLRATSRIGRRVLDMNFVGLLGAKENERGRKDYHRFVARLKNYEPRNFLHAVGPNNAQFHANREVSDGTNRGF